MSADPAPRTAVHVLGSAGIEATAQARMVELLARHVDRGRYRIKAWFVGSPGPLADRLEEAGVGVRLVPFRRGLGPGEIRGLIAAIRADRPDLLHLHVGGRALAGLARAASSVPTIVHVHAATAEDGGSVRPPLRMADAAIAPSRATAAAVAPAARVIYAGVEIPEPVPQRRSPIIGSVGRLEPLKGHPVLLDAFAAISRARPDATLELAGAGSEEPALRERAASAGIGERVRFLGWAQDVSPLLRRWRVLAVPSLAEGLPLAALEGMASGLPLVASRVGGLPELVSDGETGLLVPPGDPDSLRLALDALLDDDDLAARLGVAGRRRVADRFTAARTAERIVALYDEVLAAGSPRWMGMRRRARVA